MLISNSRAKSVSGIPSSLTAQKKRKLLALGLIKQLSQAIRKLLPILLVSKYLSTLYAPDQNVMKNTGSLPATCPPSASPSGEAGGSRGSGEAGRRRVGLILAWANFYHFPAVLSIYL